VANSGKSASRYRHGAMQRWLIKFVCITAAVSLAFLIRADLPWEWRYQFSGFTPKNRNSVALCQTTFGRSRTQLSVAIVNQLIDVKQQWLVDMFFHCRSINARLIIESWKLSRGRGSDGDVFHTSFFPCRNLLFKIIEINNLLTLGWTLSGANLPDAFIGRASKLCQGLIKY
jgi:hypothetical protein